MRPVPTEALRTPCVPGCPSTIEWLYDPGEMSSRMHPGYPEGIEPYSGCSDEHLEDPRLEAHASDVWRYVYQWWALEESALNNLFDSYRYLAPIMTWWKRAGLS